MYHYRNFNPRSHKGSDGGNVPEPVTREISIHAPTRGATVGGPYKVIPHFISIHAPTRGATLRCDKIHHRRNDFNPRSHKGSDPIPILKSKIKRISIHAPTRGATKYAQKIDELMEFQSTLPQGERHPSSFLFSGVGLFQSTLPQGERPLLISAVWKVPGFQSTLPQGERLDPREIFQRHLNFNPRSHKGSDNFFVHTMFQIPYFNPRSHKGSDLPYNHIYYYKAISIHAPTRGATFLLPHMTNLPQISIHAPTRGATQKSLLTFSI